MNPEMKKKNSLVQAISSQREKYFLIFFLTRRGRCFPASTKCHVVVVRNMFDQLIKALRPAGETVITC